MELFVPNFYLGDFLITCVQQETFLGYSLNDNMTDDDHITKEMRNLYARETFVILNFVRMLLKLCYSKLSVQFYIVAYCG